MHALSCLVFGECGILILDEEVLASCGFVCIEEKQSVLQFSPKAFPSYSGEGRRVLTLPADEITDLLIFGLFSGTLVVLWALFQELLLNEVDT